MSQSTKLDSLSIEFHQHTVLSCLFRLLEPTEWSTFRTRRKSKVCRRSSLGAEIVLGSTIVLPQATFAYILVQGGGFNMVEIAD